jgi:hypothetical protein
MSLAAVALAWGAFASFAADVTPPPAPVVAGPVIAGAPGCVSCTAGCETCTHGVAKSNCALCGKMLPGLLRKGQKAPFNVTLCPGSCFGYFQTQWRKWDDVCPYPYLGVGVSDAPRLPGAPLPPQGSGLNPPRPLDPKVTDPKKTDPKGTDPKMTDPKKVGAVPPSGGSAYHSYLPAIPTAPGKFGP